MKKIILTFFTLIAVSVAVKASTFQLDEAKMEQTFNSSEDVTLSLTMNSSSVAANYFMGKETKGEQNVTGYLLRSFFCGSIALHRYYMGTSRNLLWLMYCCIPVGGQVATAVDFWWVVFSGKEAMEKYRDSDKYWVFLKD